MSNDIPPPSRQQTHAIAVLVLLCSLLLHAAPANADPVHLRSPLPEQTLSWQLGSGTFLSVGAWSLPWLATAFYGRLDFAPNGSTAFLFGSSAATKFRLLGKDKGFRLDGFVAAGFEWQALPVRATGAMATLALQGIYQSKGAVFALELVGPFSLQISPNVVARLPVAAGLWVMFRAGRMWFGIYGSAGLRLVIGEPPARHIQFALVWALSLPQWFPELRRSTKR